MLRVAFVGLGWWGTELARAALSLPGKLEIFGGCSIVPDEITRFTAAFGATGYESYAAVLADPGIEAVVLSTPHSQHADQIEAAAQAGKHVFCEKPLALSLADSLRAMAACDAAGVVLAVGHNRRFLPGARALKSMLDAGDLGRPVHAQAQFSSPSALGYRPGMWRADRAEAPGGPMASMGIHMIDVMQWLLGPVARLACLGKRLAAPVDIEDTTCAIFAFEGGATGALSSLFVSPVRAEFSLHGTARNVMAHEDFARIEVQDPGAAPEPRDTGGATGENASLVTELSSFADACAGGSAYPITPVEAARNVAVLDAIARSIAADGDWVTVERVTP